jgi:2-amino-4-hydroxy-6-hydroxymethyldihydropteridine diphosphokinase
LHAPQVLHPGVQRSFADLWQTAQIAQQLQPIAFQWRGHELTPSELILAHSGA